MNELTLDDILLLYVEKQGDIFDNNFPKKDETQLFKELKEIKNLREYLRSTANKDIQRYFAAQNDKERDTVRGALSRIIYLQARLIKSDANKDEVTGDTSIPGLRYKKN